MTDPADTLAAAHLWHAAGCCVLPAATDGTKRPNLNDDPTGGHRMNDNPEKKALPVTLRGLVECSLRHSKKTYDMKSGWFGWVRGDNEDFGILIQGNGRGKYRMQCRNCGHRSSDIPRAIIQAWGLIDKPFDWVDIKPTNTYEPCSYSGCDTPETEYHHFAPRNTFSDDADNWPVLPLCVKHHREWHNRMDGYRRHTKAPTV